MDSSSTSPHPKNPGPRIGTILVALLALGLIGYYLYQQRPAASTAATATNDPSLPAGTAEQDSAAYQSQIKPPPPMLLDAEGHRILNSAGLPISSEPLPEAKPIPVKAPPGAVIGYTVDAQGVSHEIRAGDLKQVPNTPGSFAVVDMWADGGPTVVPPTKGRPLSAAELARLQAQEDARAQAGKP
jgi:hypothetical protein